MLIIAPSKNWKADIIKSEELQNCHKLGVETHVAIPAPASNAPNKKYNVSEFDPKLAILSH